MKHFPFKILIICIILPPVLYILSIQTLEGHLQTRYIKELEGLYIGDTADLFQGKVAIRDAINRNIDTYLKDRVLLSLGVKAKVTVTTGKNTILYPMVYAIILESIITALLFGAITYIFTAVLYRDLSARKGTSDLPQYVL